ncbi:hypothetical protein ACXR6G_07420 [Ancylomarina sp. YFZ004]
MKKERLWIGLGIGYMLKVMKSNIKISKYHKEFASIRHGNYYEFINLIKEPIAEMIMSNERGEIIVNPTLNKDYIDFGQLLMAGPSIKKFFNQCCKVYGNISDNEITDSLFYEIGIFEISIRMHANNYKLLTEREKFEVVIDKICRFKNIPKKDKEALQKGRRFLNMIKHFNNQFETWEDGISAFKIANEIIKKHKLLII